MFNWLEDFRTCFFNYPPIIRHNCGLKAVLNYSQNFYFIIFRGNNFCPQSCLIMSHIALVKYFVDDECNFLHQLQIPTCCLPTEDKLN